MLIHKKQLIGLSVETQSGQELGVICDFEVDGDQHTITGYVIKKSKLLPDFIAQDLIIRPKQVVSITNKKMVVDDLIIKTPELETAALPTN
ncbi:MAG: PRC-barrel domain-containing protein [Patescibacteria group bacterium]